MKSALPGILAICLLTLPRPAQAGQKLVTQGDASPQNAPQQPTTLDSRASPLRCSQKQPAALCQYAELYWQLLADCGIERTKNWFWNVIPLWTKKPIPLPVEICRHYTEEDCSVVQQDQQATDTTAAEVSLREIFATPFDSAGDSGAALAQALRKNPQLPPLPIPDFSIASLLDTRESFLLDRRNCQDARSATLSASAAAANGKYTSSSLSTAVLTLADGHFRSPLALLWADPLTQAQFDWNLLQWYLALPDKERSAQYYYVTGLNVPAGDLELHSQSARDENGAAGGNLGLSLLALSASGSLSSSEQSLVHLHQYLVPNDLSAIRELATAPLPPFTAIRDRLSNSLREVASLAMSSPSAPPQAAFLADGMPAALCQPQLWTSSGPNYSVSETFVPPTPAAPGGGCRFDITAASIPAQGTQWNVRLSPADFEFALALSPADLSLGDIHLDSTTGGFRISGAGAAGIDVLRRPTPRFSAASGCDGLPLTFDALHGEIAAGLMVNTAGLGKCQASLTQVSIPLRDGLTVTVPVPPSPAPAQAAAGGKNHPHRS